jgi:hypothetical protein
LKKTPRPDCFDQRADCPERSPSLPPRPLHRSFSGPVSFVYSIGDTNYTGGDNVTAQVTLIIAPPSALRPANYSHRAKLDTPFTPDAPRWLLTDVQSDNPAPRLQVVGVTRPPPRMAGTVTVDPIGNFTFVPVRGWYGEFTLTRALLDQVLFA